MTRLLGWLFAAPAVPTTPWRVIVWWESRRIPFNLIVGFYGVLCLLAFFWAIGTSGHLQPGEDAVEPLALLVAPFAINALYTLGWFVELVARSSKPALPGRFGGVLFLTLLSLTLTVLTLPAVGWIGVRILQGLGLAG